MAVFCYTVALTAVIKAETLVIRLRAVPKNSALCITALSFCASILVTTPRSDAQNSAESLIFANCSANSQPYAKIV
jgi:hypothetical protein